MQNTEKIEKFRPRGPSQKTPVILHLMRAWFLPAIRRAPIVSTHL